MSSLLQVDRVEQSCAGEHLQISGFSRSSGVEWALEQILASRESRGRRVPVLTLALHTRVDAAALTQAIDWLSARGRRVIVRTRVVLAARAVQALDRARAASGGAVVELELAHHRPDLQRALLGAQAHAAAALLLQAQHLGTLGIPLVARLAPLFPGVHDRGEGFAPLLRHLAAADIHRAQLELGELQFSQLRALIAVKEQLSAAGLLELARAFSLDPMVVLGGAPVSEDFEPRLRTRRAQAFTVGLESIARDAGLELPSCGCDAHCELVPAVAANDAESGYEPVRGRDLFAGLSSSA